MRLVVLHAVATPSAINQETRREQNEALIARHSADP